MFNNLQKYNTITNKNVQLPFQVTYNAEKRSLSLETSETSIFSKLKIAFIKVSFYSTDFQKRFPVLFIVSQ